MEVIATVDLQQLLQFLLVEVKVEIRLVLMDVEVMEVMEVLVGVVEALATVGLHMVVIIRNTVVMAAMVG